MSSSAISSLRRTTTSARAEVVVRRNDEIALDDIDALAPQKIVISPGPCTPSESGISLAVIQHYAGKLPILGVCLGHQAIAVPVCVIGEVLPCMTFAARTMVAPKTCAMAW